VEYSSATSTKEIKLLNIRYLHIGTANAVITVYRRNIKTKGEIHMKKLVLTLAAVMAFSVPAAFAADHSGHDMHSGMANMGGTAHEEVIDGVKATFTVQTMADAMKDMGMEMPKGVKETHHISLKLKDVKSGKDLTEGEAKVKIQGPDKKEQTKDMMGMHGHFGADFDMAKKGKYGIMCKFKTADGKTRPAKFWYTVK
jgi:hypothetical protein